MAAVTENFPGNGLVKRAMRGSAWIVLGYTGGQAMRFGANLILTRFLFPEAFGLMALVTVFIVGLSMFSDLGTAPSIARSTRGDDPDFLNTAWTIQVIRGFALWLASCLLAWPVAAFYGEPSLLYLLPITGFSLVIAGFDPTRIETAHRHLAVARVTQLDMISQGIGILAMIVVAILYQSVFALVVSTLVGTTARLWLMSRYLPGARNRFRWEPEAAKELMQFGKWIFASTVCAFFSSQGDRAILAKALTFALLGIYNIGYFLASFPILLGQAVTGRVMIPIYRETAQAATEQSWRKLRVMRFALTAGLLSLVLCLAFIGVPLVHLLYDDRYVAAGAVLVAVSCIQVPIVIGLSYEHAALAAGDSRGYFWLAFLRALAQVLFLMVGAHLDGLQGALIGMGLAAVVIYPVIIWLARRHRVWDPLHDLFYAVIAGALALLALWLNWSALVALG